MEDWEEKALEAELKTSPEERLRWLAQAARFLWEAATPEVREIYESASRDELGGRRRGKEDVA